MNINKDKLKIWLISAGMRSLRTFGQTLLTLITMSQTFQEVKWDFVIGSCVLSVIICLANCLVSLPEYEYKKEELL